MLGGRNSSAIVSRRSVNVEKKLTGIPKAGGTSPVHKDEMFRTQRACLLLSCCVVQRLFVSRHVFLDL